MSDDTCIVCKGKVDWKVVCEELGHILDRVDMYGVESLTENEQWVYHGRICSSNCFYNIGW